MTGPLDIQQGDHILVSRTDRLGDLILALPLAETLKIRYPECRISVLASLYASPVLENNDRIDGIVRVQNDQLVNNRRYKRELLQTIVRGGYRAVVVLYPERRISRMLYDAGIPNRIGTAGRFHSAFFNYRLYHSRKENKKHELEYNLDFLKFFQAGSTVATPVVCLLDREISNAKRILRETGIGADFVVLHPGSGGSADSWPLEHFFRLYAILADSDLDVIISGSAEEAETYGQLMEVSGEPVKTITGQTDVRTLAAVLSLASVVVANSTGPLHLAAAVGTRVVGLYPRKNVMSPVRWGPIGEGHRVVQPSSPECDCPPRECRCMSTITADRVAEEVMAIYRRT